ncbi:MAG: hypothetical protein ACM3QZ_12480 [Solirubrobacterales bacterium]
MPNWKLINDCVQELIEVFPRLDSGLNLVQRCVEDEFEVDCPDLIPAMRASYQEFGIWLADVFQEEPLPAGIVALNLGLFENSGGIQLYVSGAQTWEPDDPEWAHDMIYWPENRHAPSGLLGRIFDEAELDEDACLYLGLAAVIVFTLELAREKPDLFDADTLFVCTGYDDGELYSFGRINPTGIEPLIED